MTSGIRPHSGRDRRFRLFVLLLVLVFAVVGPSAHGSVAGEGTDCVFVEQDGAQTASAGDSHSACPLLPGTGQLAGLAWPRLALSSFAHVFEDKGATLTGQAAQGLMNSPVEVVR